MFLFQFLILHVLVTSLLKTFIIHSFKCWNLLLQQIVTSNVMSSFCGSFFFLTSLVRFSICASPRFRALQPVQFYNFKLQAFTVSSFVIIFFEVNFFVFVDFRLKQHRSLSTFFFHSKFCHKGFLQGYKRSVLFDSLNEIYKLYSNKSELNFLSVFFLWSIFV